MKKTRRVLRVKNLESDGSCGVFYQAWVTPPYFYKHPDIFICWKYLEKNVCLLGQLTARKCIRGAPRMHKGHDLCAL